MKPEEWFVDLVGRGTNAFMVLMGSLWQEIGNSGINVNQYIKLRKMYVMP